MLTAFRYVLLALSMDPLPEIAAVANVLVQLTLAATQNGLLLAPQSAGAAGPQQPPAASSIKKSTSMCNVARAGSPLHEAMQSGGFTRAASMLDFGASSGAPASSEFKISESDFFEWCRQQWVRTLLEHNITADEQEEWSNKKTLKREMQMNHSAAAESFAAEKKPKKFSSQIAMFDNTCRWSSLLLFDAKEPCLYVADSKEFISTWDLPSGLRTNQFQTPTGGRVTTLLSLNQFIPGTLLAGTDDGVVSVFQNAHSASEQQLQTAWTAVPDLISMGARGPGLVCDWQQEEGILLASGSVNKVKVWDVVKQMCVHDMPTNTDYPVTCMASTQPRNCLWAGCGDGVIRIFDCRQPDQLSALPTLHGHSGPVVCIHFPLSNQNLAISGARPAGSHDASLACFWDLRQLSEPVSPIVYLAHTIGPYVSGGGQVSQFQASGSGSLTAMSSHNYASVLACGFQEQMIKIFDHQGKELNRIKYHEGYVGQRIGPVSCLAFHPCLPYLAVGAEDSYIALFKRK